MRQERQKLQITRRSLLRGGAAFGGGLMGTRWRGLVPVPGAMAQTPASPPVVTQDNQRPQVPYGVMSGDPSNGQAVIWGKTDRPARMLVSRVRDGRISAIRAGTPDRPPCPSDYATAPA
jgi:alkaline phosphatase D